MEQLKIGEIKIKQTRLVSPDEILPPYYVFSQSIDLNLYDDISSNYNWMNVGSITYDFNFCRNQVSLLTNSVEWSGLTVDEKTIAAQLFVVDKEKRDEVLTEDEQFIFWGELVRNSQNSRYKRWEAAKKYISYNISPSESSDLGKTTSELCNDYINYNIITKDKDGVSGLFDYLKGEGDFLELGLSSKPYWTQTLQNNILNILENGIY